MKIPLCKNCGGRHYTYQCWSKPRTRSYKKATSHSKKYHSSKRQNLIKELDHLTSLYVRQKNADKYGMNICYTCGRKFFWKDLDCGHYIKRRFLNTRWDLDNLRPQCQYCNRNLGGNYRIYENKIANELGQEAVMKLWDKAYSQQKILDVELEQMIIEMKMRLKMLAV